MGILAVICSVGSDLAGLGFRILVWCSNGGFGGLVWCFRGGGGVVWLVWCFLVVGSVVLVFQ